MASNPSLILMAVTFVCGLLIGGSGVFLFMLRVDRQAQAKTRAKKRVDDLDHTRDAAGLPGSHRRAKREAAR